VELLGRGEPQPAAHPRGTTVEVRSLFEKVPARRKFLRTRKTEFFHIQQILKRVALSRFDTTFRLTHNGRLGLNLPAARDAAGQLNRLAKLYGSGFAKAAIAIDTAIVGLRVSGWIAGPQLARTQADAQNLCLNGRIIRDRFLARAVRAAYGDSLPADRHPVYLLHVDIDPGGVDVNVHPAKAEVRFRDARTVHDILYSVIHRALGGEPLSGVAVTVAASPARDFGAVRNAGAVSEQWAPYRAVSEALPKDGSANSGTGVHSLGNAICCVGTRYIIATKAEQLVVIDAAGAYRRLTHQRLRDSLVSMQLSSRPLLIPETIRLTKESALVIEKAAEPLASLGVDVVRTGPEEVRILGLPAYVESAALQGLTERMVSCVRAFVDDLDWSIELQETILKLVLEHSELPREICLDRARMDKFLRELETLACRGRFEVQSVARTLDVEGLEHLFRIP